MVRCLLERVRYRSSCDLSSDEENKKLIYLHFKFMYDIIITYSNTTLFNDQIVVKEPNEGFSFEPHRDNQYDPFPTDKELLTINCMLVLDDLPKKMDKLGWWWMDNFISKDRDILMIEGNTTYS